MTLGRLLLAVAALHELVGLAEGHAALLAIGRGGFVGAVEPDPSRMAVFWFLAAGVLLGFLGLALHALEARGEPLSRAFPAGLVVFGLLGGLAIPASGFWLLLGLGIYGWVKTSRA